MRKGLRGHAVTFVKVPFSRLPTMGPSAAGSMLCLRHLATFHVAGSTPSLCNKAVKVRTSRPCLNHEVLHL